MVDYRPMALFRATKRMCEVGDKKGVTRKGMRAKQPYASIRPERHCLFEVDPKLGIEEGDFTGVDGALAIIGARLAPKQNKDKIDSESIIEELKLLLCALMERRPGH